VGGVERRRDGADFHVERGRDAAVVEIGEVAEEDDEALALGQLSEPRIDAVRVSVVVCAGSLNRRCDLFRRMSWPGAVSGVENAERCAIARAKPS
jgi:hypothetical protein